MEAMLKKTKKSELLTLFLKHGIEIFGSDKKLNLWLDKENFYLDKKKPKTFLKTNKGIQFLDDRLTNIEYGDLC